MDDQDDSHLTGRAAISHVRKTDDDVEMPLLEDIPLKRQSCIMSPSSNDAEDDDLQFFETFKSKKVQETPSFFQPVSVPTNADPAMATLLAALNQTNALILQQNDKIGALEKGLHSRSPLRRHLQHQSHSPSP